MQIPTSFLTCHRCMQPLRLDESLNDEALSSNTTSNSGAASSSSNEGLGGGGWTKSHYEVISSMLDQQKEQQQQQQRVTQERPLSGGPPALQAAVREHYKNQAHPHSDTSPNSLSSRLALHTRLFDLASSLVLDSSNKNSTTAATSLTLGIDHPMCLDCSDFVLSILRREIDDTRRERAALKEWSKHMESNPGDHDVVAKMEAEIVGLQHQVKRATDGLYQSEKAKGDLEEELRLLDMEEKELEAEEAEFWEAHSKLLSETSSLESTRASLQRSLENQQCTLDRLNATNVFFDAFSIGNESSGSGPTSSRKSSSGGGNNNKAGTSSSSSSSSSSPASLATINGLRFGRVSSSSSATAVEWNEVNAAWGQVALLMEVLRCKIAGSGKCFSGWRIHCRGSTSFLKKVSSHQQQGEGATGVGSDHHNSHASATSAAAAASSASTEDVYELYHPGPWTPITRMLHSRRFDAAMVGILDCTSQLYSWAATTSSSASPPRMIHLINGDKVGDVSIRLAGAFGFTSEESWSRACRYLLVDLQVLMNWITRDEVVPVPMPVNGGATSQDVVH